mgnify:CR=1 FL=1
MIRKLFLSKKLLVMGMFLSGCDKKGDTPVTNPDAIVELLQQDEDALITNDPDFISPDTLTFYPALDGDFQTRRFALILDSGETSFEVFLGDTVTVNNLLAREAEAESHYELYYTLWLSNLDSVVATKQLVTDLDEAYKNHYLLQLGSSGGTYRGWLFWGTTRRFDLVRPFPTLSWTSQEKGEIIADQDIILLSEFVEFNERDLISVTYTGGPDDIAFLTINEDGTPERIEMNKLSGSNNTYRASWRISSNPLDKPFFYAGVEVYDYETLADPDSSKTDFWLSGLMYSIAED